MDNKKLEYYDVLVVGGGIIGASIYNELSLHGIKCLLLEKYTFGSQTSSASSKMLHGGLRYLESFDFDLVYESLTERNLWTKILPSFVQKKMFHFPIFKNSRVGKFKLRLGIILYYLFSKEFNLKNIFSTPKEILSLIPLLRSGDLLGAFNYHDAIMDDKKIVEEIIKKTPSLSFAQENAEYQHIFDFKNKTFLVQYNQKKILCKHIVFALGPFTDHVLKKEKFINWNPIIVQSRGAHLWISKKDLPIEEPVVYQTHDERVLFFIPHENKILIGTTDQLFNDYPGNIAITNEEKNYLLSYIKEVFPDSHITQDHIMSSIAGVRPLVRDGNNQETKKISRKHALFIPHSHISVIAGGKYTTFRIMSQDVVKRICSQENISYKEHLFIEQFQKR